MQNKFKKILVFLMALAPLSALATNLGMANLFTPTQGDLSITFLGQLFGSVGGVLHGTGGQMLGQIFSIMNSGVVVVMTSYFGYSLFTFVISTASEGEFMGRNKNSAFVALRTVGGLSLAIPSKATGYCLAQTIVMWSIVQGVGLADHAWNRVVDYLAKDGGTLYVSTPNVTNLSDLITPSQKILESEVCMTKLRNIMDSNNQANQNFHPLTPTNSTNNSTNSGMPLIGPPQQSGNPTPLVVVPVNSSNTQVGYSFDTKTQTVNFGIQDPKNPGNYGNQCGSVNWTITVPKKEKKSDDDKTIINYYSQMALQQMVLDLLPAAQAITDSTTHNDPNEPANLTDPAALKTQIQQNMVTAIVDYANIVRPATNKIKSDGQKDIKKSLEDSKSKGWIVAGSYYRDLTQINTNTKEDLKAFIPSPQGASLSTNIGITQDQIQQVQAAMNTVGDNIDQVKKDLSTIQDALGQGSSGLAKSSVAGLAAGVYLGGTALAIPTFLAGGNVLSYLTFDMSMHIGTLVVLWGQTVNSAGDPILNLQTFGEDIIGIAVSLWVTATGIIFWAPMAGRFMSSINPFTTAISDSLRWFTPVVFGVMVSLFAMGLMLATYLPLIPYLVYTFAGIGWLISVLEAMAAAPLVALGITHPEGHDFLGKAEQALMLLFSVFLRPILLLIGLVAALILMQVSVRLINSGFNTVVSSALLHTSHQKSVALFTVTALIVAYTMLQISVINMVCNAVIPGVAAKVMGWLGLHPESVSYEGQLQSIAGATQGAGELAGKGAMSEMPQSTEAINKQAEKTKAEFDNWEPKKKQKPSDTEV